MRSLLVHIFLAFLLIIAVTIGVAAISGHSYSERLREALDNFEVSDSLLEASESLRSGGRKGLEKWLRNLPRTSPMNVYVIDQRGRGALCLTLTPCVLLGRLRDSSTLTVVCTRFLLCQIAAKAAGSMNELQATF